MAKVSTNRAVLQAAITRNVIEKGASLEAELDYSLGSQAVTGGDPEDRQKVYGFRVVHLPTLKLRYEESALYENSSDLDSRGLEDTLLLLKSLAGRCCVTPNCNRVRPWKVLLERPVKYPRPEGYTPFVEPATPADRETHSTREAELAFRGD